MGKIFFTVKLPEQIFFLEAPQMNGRPLRPPIEVKQLSGNPSELDLL